MKILFISLIFFTMLSCTHAQNQSVDEKVQSFLKKHKNDWHDLNVPFEDGQILYDLITDITQLENLEN